MAFELRPYQVDAIPKLFAWLQENSTGWPIVSAAVGAGKSVLIAALIQHIWSMQPDTRVLMLVHVKELIAQNLEKLLAVWPEAPVGVYSAGLARRELEAPILYASIQSMASRATRLGPVGVVFIDECHLVNRDSASRYHRLIATLRERNPQLCLIGLTGTPFHADGTWLMSGRNTLFADVAVHIGMRELLALGYLVPLVNASAPTLLDTTAVGTRQGDYIVGELAEAVDTAELVAAACAELVRLAAERKRWLVYCVTIEHALHVCDALRALGIDCEAVFGLTAAGERDRIVRAFRAGRLHCLVNVAVFTTGFDVPELDCIALLRPTQSQVLYVQMLGRGMRPSPGKSDCLLLDFSDTVERLGPVDCVTGHDAPETRAAPASVRHCPECGARVPPPKMLCPCCGHVFEPAVPPERKMHEARVSTAAVLSGTEIKVVSVDRLRVSRHIKAGRPDSLKVDYYGGLLPRASEWLCLEHGGYATQQAGRKWWQLSRGTTPPRSVSEALQRLDELVPPRAIGVRRNGKYKEVTHYEFD